MLLYEEKAYVVVAETQRPAFRWLGKSRLFSSCKQCSKLRKLISLLCLVGGHLFIVLLTKMPYVGTHLAGAPQLSQKEKKTAKKAMDLQSHWAIQKYPKKTLL